MRDQQVGGGFGATAEDRPQRRAESNRPDGPTFVNGQEPATGQIRLPLPQPSCRHHLVEPEVLPAATVIRLDLPGPKDWERVDAHGRPDSLIPATAIDDHHRDYEEHRKGVE